MSEVGCLLDNPGCITFNMKLGCLSLSALALGTQLGLVSAKSFENTAPVLVSSNLAEGIESKYIDSISNVNTLLDEVMEEFCAKKEGTPLIYLRLFGFDEFQLSSIDFIETEKSNLKTLTNLVVYPSKDSVSSIEPGKSCVNTAYFNSVEEIPSNYRSQLQVAFIDIHYNDDIKENIETITANLDLENLIVQVVPTFESPSNSLLQKTSEKIREIIDSTKKREEIDYDAVEQELKDSFEEINQLLDESPVSAWDDETTFTKNDKSTIANPNGSLFDNYAFFSTGIWMTTIVFLFLAWLLSIALGWLSDLKISYRAFDKPIDFEKKMQ
ncbi:hypothetical protein CANINC_000300 [Pichia inconspicua]|uniref:Protein BIG1 n=1 Tax=Pichia inconspicua TaxID=52247 RepID=A0A4T0X6B5_9ASCO|nr:hypothetical protein CANINC_000300 [[Candida] inconspicua]